MGAPRAEQFVEHVLAQLLAQLSQRLDQRSERDRHLAQLDAATDDRQHTDRTPLTDRLANETGLTDPRVTGEQHDACAPPSRLGHRSLQRVEFVAAAEQRVTRDPARRLASIHPRSSAGVASMRTGSAVRSSRSGLGA